MLKGVKVKVDVSNSKTGINTVIDLGKSTVPLNPTIVVERLKSPIMFKHS